MSGIRRFTKSPALSLIDHAVTQDVKKKRDWVLARIACYLAKSVHPRESRNG
jgi:hypothetical protein